MSQLEEYFRIHIVVLFKLPNENELKWIVNLIPDRIYLIDVNGFWATLPGITTYLEENVNRVEIKQINANGITSSEILAIIASIVTKEKGKNNEIFQMIFEDNIDSAILATMCAIYYKTIPFRIVHDNIAFHKVPEYNIQRPSAKILQFLNLMVREMGGENVIQKRLILDLSINMDEEMTGSLTNLYNKLNYKYLNPCKNLGFIEINKDTHSTISITEKGFEAIKLFPTEGKSW